MFTIIALTCLTEPREPPSDVKAYGISSSEIRVIWKLPTSGPGKPRGYEVRRLVSDFVCAYTSAPSCMRKVHFSALIPTIRSPTGRTRSRRTRRRSSGP